MDKKRLLEVLVDFGERRSIDFDPNTHLVDEGNWVNVFLFTPELYPAHSPVMLTVYPNNPKYVCGGFYYDMEHDNYGADGYGESTAVAYFGNYIWEEHVEICKAHARAYADCLRAELSEIER